MKRALRALEHFDSALGIFLILPIVFLVVAMLLGFFPLSQPRIFLNQRGAVGSIRKVNRAEHNYAARHPETGFACNFSDLSEQGEPPTDDILRVRRLASGPVDWYHFEIRCPEDGSQKATRYTITAVPVEPGITGKFALCSDQSGESWYSENGSASECLAMRKPVERKYR